MLDTFMVKDCEIMKLFKVILLDISVTIVEEQLHHHARGL